MIVQIGLLINVVQGLMVFPEVCVYLEILQLLVNVKFIVTVDLANIATHANALIEIYIPWMLAWNQIIRSGLLQNQIMQIFVQTHRTGGVIFAHQTSHIVYICTGMVVLVKVVIDISVIIIVLVILNNNFYKFFLFSKKFVYI